MMHKVSCRWNYRHAFVTAISLLMFAAFPFAAMASGAALTDLGLSVGQLAQPFAPDTYNYFAIVPETEPTITVTPVAANADAVITVSINGDSPQQVDSGAATEPLTLEIGTNVIVVNVTAETETATYRVTVPKRAVRFQRGAGGYEGTVDAQLIQAVRYSSHNTGAQHKYEVGYSGPWARDQKYVLIRFEDLNIPADADITEATVNLWYYGDRASSGQVIRLLEKEVYIHRIRIPWNEGTGGNESSHDGDPALEGEVSWDTFMSEPAPYHFEVLDTVVIGQEEGWYSWDITGLANDWLHGVVPNYGVLLKTFEYPSNDDERMVGTKQFRSSEYHEVEKRPYLSVVYTMPLAGLTLDMHEVKLAVGESVTVTAFPRPLNAVYDAIEWTTSNSAVVNVAEGVLTAVGVGEAVITATIGDGDVTYSAELKVTVE